MKKFVKIGSSLFIAALFLLTSSMVGCKRDTQDDIAMPTTTPVAIAAGIDPAKSSAATLASGIRDTEFKIGDAIGVYVVAYRKPNVEGVLEAVGNYADNTKSTKNASDWTNAPVIYYPNVKVDMYAYYPYSAAFTPTATPASYKFVVAADQSSESKVTACDFMTSQITAQGTTITPINMTFYHRMSKMDVKFKVPQTYQGKTIASVQSVTFKGFKSDAVVDLLARYTYGVDGTASAGTYPKLATVDANSAVIDIIPNQVAAGTIGATPTEFQYEAIIVPQTRLKGIGFVEIVVNYQAGGTEKFFYAPLDDISFPASRSTVITLEFKPDNTIVLGNVEIVGWGEATPESGSVVEKEVFNTFTLGLGGTYAQKITTVDVTVSQGTGTAIEQTYTLPADNAVGSANATFAFDGITPSPEYYPFKIKKVSCKDATNTLVVDVVCDKEVTAAGAVTLP